MYHHAQGQPGDPTHARRALYLLYGRYLFLTHPDFEWRGIRVTEKPSVDTPIIYLNAALGRNWKMLCTKAGNLLCLEPEEIWELVLHWPFTSWESLGEGKLREMLGQAQRLVLPLPRSSPPLRETRGQGSFTVLTHMAIATNEGSASPL